MLFMKPRYKPKMLCIFVHDTQLRARRIYDEAHSAVHQARSHAPTVEERANALIQEMNARHQSELTRVQDVANQLQYQAHVRSEEADAQLQKLMAVVESQNQALETQRVRNEELSAHVAAVMLRHSSVPVAPSQDPNGAVNQEELSIVVDSLRREIRQSPNPNIPIQLPGPLRMSIATPPHDTQSACAGYPPAYQGPPSPVKGPRSAHASTAMPPLVPPPGQSPSGSSSSSKEGQHQGGFHLVGLMVHQHQVIQVVVVLGVVHIHNIQVCIALVSGLRPCHPKSLFIAIKHCSP